MSYPPLSLLHRAPASRWLFVVTAALAAILLMSSPAWADSDSCAAVTLSLHGKPVFCTIPETTPELPLSITLTKLSFTASAQGMILLYENSMHTVLSDVVEFTNVAGVATVNFISDTDGVVLTAPGGIPIIASYTETEKPIFVSVALSNGYFLNAKICSDWETPNCNGASDSIRLSLGNTAIPEPGTFLLLGTGIMGSGAWRLASTSLGRRRFKQDRT